MKNEEKKQKNYNGKILAHFPHSLTHSAKALRLSIRKYKMKYTTGNYQLINYLKLCTLHKITHFNNHSFASFSLRNISFTSISSSSPIPFLSFPPLVLVVVYCHHQQENFFFLIITIQNISLIFFTKNIDSCSLPSARTFFLFILILHKSFSSTSSPRAFLLLLH